MALWEKNYLSFLCLYFLSFLCLYFLSYLLSFLIKHQRNWPSSISNLIASTNASYMCWEMDSSYVLQIIFKTSYWSFVRFIFSVIVTGSSWSLLLVWITFGDAGVAEEEDTDGDGLFICCLYHFHIFIFSYISFVYRMKCNEANGFKAYINNQYHCMPIISTRISFSLSFLSSSTHHHFRFAVFILSP